MPRKEAGKRGETWEIKTRPDLLHPVLESKHEEMAKEIKQAYYSIDKVYERVAEILDKYGIHTQVRLLYRSYAERLWQVSQKFKGKTAQNMANAFTTMFFIYGCDKEVLKEIALLFGYKVQVVVGKVRLDELEDVEIVSPKDDEVLTFNELIGKWANEPITRDKITDFFNAPFWDVVPDKPSTFPPDPHTHNVADIIFNSDVLPDTDGAYDLGSSSLRWREIRAKRGYINDVIIDDYNRLRGAVITGDTSTGEFNWIDLNDLGYSADKRYTVTVTPSPISGLISYMFQNHARYSYAKFDSSPVTIEIDLGGTIHYWRGCIIYVTKGAGDNVDEIKVEYYDTRDGLWYEYASATSTTTLIHFPGASRSYVGKWRITITATLDTGEDIRVRMIRLFNFHITTGSRLHSFPFVSAGGGYIFGELVPYPDGSVDLGTPTYRWANIYAMKVKHYTDCILPTSQPSSPEAGSMYFDAATNKLYIFNGTTWVSVTLS